MALSLRLPLTPIPGGSLTSVVQGSPIEVAQSVQTLLATTLGERAIEPEYGLPSQNGAVQIDDTDVRAAISNWEPRAIEPDIQVDGGNATVNFSIDGVATDVSISILGGEMWSSVAGPVIALRDGTLISTPEFVTDNGDGTYSPIGPWVTDDGDGTYSVGG